MSRESFFDVIKKIIDFKILIFKLKELLFTQEDFDVVKYLRETFSILHYVKFYYIQRF